MFRETSLLSMSILSSVTNNSKINKNTLIYDTTDYKVYNIIFFLKFSLSLFQS